MALLQVLTYTDINILSSVLGQSNFMRHLNY